MRQLAVRIMGASMGLSILGLGFGAASAIAQDSGIANTAEDFKSAEEADGFLNSGVDVWDIFHRASSAGAGIVDDGFRRSQSRRINNQAESLRERQRAILEQQAIEATAEPEVAPAE